MCQMVIPQECCVCVCCVTLCCVKSRERRSPCSWAHWNHFRPGCRRPRGRRPSSTTTPRRTSKVQAASVRIQILYVHGSKLPSAEEQLNAALNLFESRKDPLPFFFFDFDGTLSMADGLLQEKGGGGSLQQLFGSAERRRALQAIVSRFLVARQCYHSHCKSMVWQGDRGSQRVVELRWCW